jgi:hypothetical protein
MRLAEIRNYIRAQLFRPFRVYISDGAQYDVMHRGFIMITESTVEIGLAATHADDYPEIAVSCDPLHITRIEPIKEPKGANGRKRKS